MLSRETVNTLMNLTSTAINICARENGYRDTHFIQSSFIGITENLQFCYEVIFREDDEMQSGKVYLWKDAKTDQIQFEF